MPWYSISFHHGLPTHTVIYTRHYDFLKCVIEALKGANVAGISEEPIDGWICAYCDTVNKTEICKGCGTYSPVPMEER